MPAARDVLAIILCAAIASAATTVGPSFQLVAQSDMQESLPAISVDTAMWNDTAAHAGHFTPPQPIANPISLAASPYRDAGIASIGDETFAVWLRNDDVTGQRIDRNGNAIGAPSPIAFVDSRHTQRIAVAAGRDRVLVALVAQSRIVGTTIDINGNLIEYSIPLVDGVFGRNVERVSLAWNGSEFLLVWDASTSEPWVTPCTLACSGEDRDVHAVIIDADGHARRETETVLATGAGDPDVASNGRDFIVAWARFGGGISVQTIGHDPVMMTSGHDYGPHLGWDGTAYDLAWINADNGLALNAARIGTNGLEPIVFGRSYGGFQSRDFDLAAGDGKILLAAPADGHLRLQVLSVTPASSSRVRAVRH